MKWDAASYRATFHSAVVSSYAGYQRLIQFPTAPYVPPCPGISLRWEGHTHSRRAPFTTYYSSGQVKGLPGGVCCRSPQDGRGGG